MIRPEGRSDITIQQIIEFVLCVLIPPLAVFLHAGTVNIHLLISIVLWILGVIPAIIHAMWYCFCRAGPTTTVTI